MHVYVRERKGGGYKCIWLVLHFLLCVGWDEMSTFGMEWCCSRSGLALYDVLLSSVYIDFKKCSLCPV